MFVYMMGAFTPKRIAFIKVGVTSDIAGRMKTLQTGQAFEIRLIYAWQAKGRMHAFDQEAAVHEQFRRERVRGEWYRHYMIRKLHAYIEKRMGAAAIVADNSRGARGHIKAMHPTETADLRMLANLRRNGLAA